MRKHCVPSMWGFRPNLGALDFTGGPEALTFIGYRRERKPDRGGRERD